MTQPAGTAGDSTQKQRRNARLAHSGDHFRRVGGDNGRLSAHTLALDAYLGGNEYRNERRPGR